VKLAIRHLRKTFAPSHGAPVHAIDDVSLDVADGELLVVLGPSGSGKTTLLRCIAGLERPDEGEISIDDKLVFSSAKRTWVPPERRGISMVFQGYALWPHMTVFDNVAYPLRSERLARATVQDSVARTLDLVGCGALGARYPSQLSGGQQQRVAVARAIVNASGMVLFDEPLSNVDARVREELRSELSALQRRLRFTAVYITHDQTEAVVMADSVAVFAGGKVLQKAPPRELYDHPATTFVAEFMGAANRLAGVVGTGDGGRTMIQTDAGAFEAAASTTPTRPGDAVVMIFRPEHCRIDNKPSSSANSHEGVVERSVFLGTCTEYRVRINHATIAVRSMNRPILAEGTTAWIAVEAEDISVMGTP
jgi:iron(III) transport system ATP-binding protein